MEYCASAAKHLSHFWLGEEKCTFDQLTKNLLFLHDTVTDLHDHAELMKPMDTHDELLDIPDIDEPEPLNA
ncbi:MAG TPA: hypothetical protein DCP91_02760 [Eggerthellaceae bacterium]|nr:hypothetical protein [Eggerthellaceae bacterium]